ncbi:MAG: hypothetical protein SGI89_00575 [bacterium]|nr:hypothetical protein [bacterium]
MIYSTFQKWFSERKIGWQPLIVFLIVAFLFSQTTDPVPLLGNIKAILGINEHQFKLLLNLPLYLALIIFWVLDNRKLFRIFIIIYILSDMTVFFIYVYKLVNTIGMFQGGLGASDLLIDALTMWLINIILFSLLYWILDSGGPYARIRNRRENMELLFPQYTLNNPAFKEWSPDIIDYFALAFSTSTTFGPTDTMFLSRRLKFLMIVQVLLSLTILTILATRAVTIIN